MNCKTCKKTIDDDSIYCKWCGELQIRKRKKATDVALPKPTQLKSGKWSGQIMINGQRHRISADSQAEFYALANGLKKGIVEPPSSVFKNSVAGIVENYINANSSLFSPSTIRGYWTIRRTRFKAAMDMSPLEVDWQTLINAEAASVSPKTVNNSWRLITASMKHAKLTPPDVNLPKVPASERNWLDYEQILILLNAIKDSPCELGALLALHSLRRSEIYDLTVDDISNGIIRVHGAAVFDSDNKVVFKATNKNVSSAREIPIMIPRLLEILPKDGHLVSGNPNTLWRQINKVCSDAGLPLVGVHGLRHSFASLAYHLGWSELQTMSVGGWSDFATVRNVYTHLSSKERSDAVQKMASFYENYSKIT